MSLFYKYIPTRLAPTCKTTTHSQSQDLLKETKKKKKKERKKKKREREQEN